MNFPLTPFKRVLTRNDGGVWGDDPAGEGDTVVLRSTDIALDGSWAIDDPARRRLSASETLGARLEVGDLVVVKSSGSATHLGKSALVNRVVAEMRPCFANFVQRLRVAPDVDRRFAWYFMNSRFAAQQLDRFGTTTTGLRNLNGETLGALEFPLPPRSVQSAVADYLDRETTRLDALIAAKGRMVALLEEKRTVILLDAVAPHLAAGLPDGWAKTRLKYLFDSPAAGAWGEEADGRPHDILCVRVADFDRSRFRVDARAATLRSVDETVKRKCLLKQGDVLIEKSGGGDAQPVGFAVVFDLGTEAICSNFIARLRPVATVDPTYAGRVLAAAYRAECNVPFVKQTTGIQNLDMQAYLSLDWCVPPPAAQRAICERLASEFAALDEFKQTLATQLTLLQERRRVLITAAVTGELDIAEAA